MAASGRPYICRWLPRGCGFIDGNRRARKDRSARLERRLVLEGKAAPSARAEVPEPSAGDERDDRSSSPRPETADITFGAGEPGEPSGTGCAAFHLLYPLAGRGIAVAGDDDAVERAGPELLEARPSCAAPLPGPR